jgi:hypothetical protein
MIAALKSIFGHAALSPRGAGEALLRECRMKNSSVERIKNLIDEGADLEVKDTHGMTALLCAACHGRTDVVQILIEAGADVEARDTGNMTALLWAACHRRTAVVQILIDAGADVEAKDTHGMTALMTAAHYGYAEMVRLLLDAGADIAATCAHGLSALDRVSGPFTIGKEEAKALLQERHQKKQAGWLARGMSLTKPVPYKAIKIKKPAKGN